MIVQPNVEQARVIQGVADALHIHPDEVAAAIIEAGITWLIGREIGQRLDAYPLEKHPGTKRIAVVLAAAYRNQSARG